MRFAAAFGLLAACSSSAELAFDDYDTVEAHCRVDLGPVTVVPYTLLPPVD